MAKLSEKASKLDKVGETPRESIWIPSGSDVMDLVIGGGRGLGYEAGMIVNFCAQSGGGKTLCAVEIVANAYHKFKDKCRWVYDDAESGFTFNTKALYGFDIIPSEGAIRSTTIEDCFANVMGFLNSLKGDEFGIYVIDSLDGLVSEEIDDIVDERLDAHAKGKEFTKGSYQGGKPKFLSSVFLPKVAEAAHRKNCLVIIISQLRDNIGGGLYAPKDRVSNGRALLFYCDARVWITAKQTVEVAGRDIGYILHVTTKKMRGHRPYREGLISVYFQYGIDNVGTNIDYLFDVRTPERGDLKKTEAKSLEWSADVPPMSRQKLIAYIEDNQLENVLTGRVIAKWEDLEAVASAEVAGRKKRF